MTLRPQRQLDRFQPHRYSIARSWSDAAGPLNEFREDLFTRWLVSDSLSIEPRNAILDEQHDFVISIQSGGQPTVSGADGARAVNIAEQVLEAIDCRQWLGTQTGPEQTGCYATPHETVEAASRRFHRQDAWRNRDAKLSHPQRDFLLISDRIATDLPSLPEYSPASSKLRHDARCQSTVVFFIFLLGNHADGSQSALSFQLPNTSTQKLTAPGVGA
ncbi:MAG: hypothetical protein R3C05_23910 [Pirellulaceae bacterium]